MAVYVKDGKTVWAKSDTEAEKKLAETTSTSTSSRRKRSSTTQLQRAESRLENLSKGSTAHELQLREIAKLKGTSYSEYIKSTGDDKYFKDEAVTKTHDQKETEVKQELEQAPQKELQFKRESFEDIGRREAETEVQQDITKRQFMGETTLAGVGATGQVIREYETKRPAYRGYVEREVYYKGAVPKAEKLLDIKEKELQLKIDRGELTVPQAELMISEEQLKLDKGIRTEGQRIYSSTIKGREKELTQIKKEVLRKNIAQETYKIQEDVKAVKGSIQYVKDYFSAASRGEKAPTKIKMATPSQWYTTAKQIQLPEKSFAQSNFKEGIPYLKKAGFQIIPTIREISTKGPINIIKNPIQVGVGVTVGTILTLTPTPFKLTGAAMIGSSLIHGTAVVGGALYLGQTGKEIYDAKGDRIQAVGEIAIRDAPFMTGLAIGGGLGSAAKKSALRIKEIPSKKSIVIKSIKTKTTKKGEVTITKGTHTTIFKKERSFHTKTTKKPGETKGTYTTYIRNPEGKLTAKAVEKPYTHKVEVTPATKEIKLGSSIKGTGVEPVSPLLKGDPAFVSAALKLDKPKKPTKELSGSIATIKEPGSFSSGSSKGSSSKNTGTQILTIKKAPELTTTKPSPQIKGEPTQIKTLETPPTRGDYKGGVEPIPGAFEFTSILTVNKQIEYSAGKLLLLRLGKRDKSISYIENSIMIDKPISKEFDTKFTETKRMVTGRELDGTTKLKINTITKEGRLRPDQESPILFEIKLKYKPGKGNIFKSKKGSVSIGSSGSFGSFQGSRIEFKPEFSLELKPEFGLKPETTPKLTSKLKITNIPKPTIRPDLFLKSSQITNPSGRGKTTYVAQSGGDVPTKIPSQLQVNTLTSQGVSTKIDTIFTSKTGTDPVVIEETDFIPVVDTFTDTFTDTKIDSNFDPFIPPTFIFTPTPPPPSGKGLPGGLLPGKGQVGKWSSQGRRLGFEKKGYMPSLGAMVIKSSKPKTKKGKPKARKYAGLFYRPVYK